jgi:hypothetical protein
VRRRKLLLGTLAGLVALAGAAALAQWPRPERVTPENYARIRVGMSRAEVYAILGTPGDYTTGDVAPSGTRPQLGWHQQGTSMEQWTGDRAVIGVYFDGTGNVVSGVCFLLQPVDHGPLGNLLWRLKRLWRRWFP